MKYIYIYVYFFIFFFSKNLHLLVNWARRTLSLAKFSSRSKRSKAGGGKSLRTGAKTAGWSGGNGVSNYNF